MKIVFLFVALLCALGLMYSCNGRTDSSMQKETKKVRPLDWEGRYLSPEGEPKQVLEVKVSKDEVSFNYSIVKDGNACYSLAGRAILKVGDLEWDDDEEGVAYPVDEYVYDSACYMAVRIEADSHRLARIVTDDERVLKLIGEDAATMVLVK